MPTNCAAIYLHRVNNLKTYSFSYYLSITCPPCTNHMVPCGMKECNLLEEVYLSLQGAHREGLDSRERLHRHHPSFFNWPCRVKIKQDAKKKVKLVLENGGLKFGPGCQSLEVCVLT